LAQYVMGEQVKDIAQAIDQLTSFENLYLIVTVLELITGKEILLGTPNDVYQLIDWARDWFHKDDERGTWKDLFETLLQEGTLGGQFGLWDWLD
jgi:hypothetical protein